MVSRRSLAKCFAEGPRYTPVPQGLNYLGLQHAGFRIELGGCHIVYDSRPNRLRHAHKRRIHWLIRSTRKALLWIRCLRVRTRSPVNISSLLNR